MIEILLTALGLSMDAMAISVCNALCYPNMKRSMRLAIPLSFGLFQGVMPLLGILPEGCLPTSSRPMPASSPSSSSAASGRT